MRAKDTLRNLNIRPVKERGQNFLIDERAVLEIAEFGKISTNQHIVEIGPGLGALTKELVGAKKLTLIEIEDKFCQDLAVKYPDVEIISSDVRQVNFEEIGESLLVFGNLPYSFSTDIIFHLVKYATVINRAVLLLQKEFAQRLAAKEGGRIYGTISISCQLHADINLGPVIQGTSFHPPARVDSQLVELNFLKAPRFEVSDMAIFRKVVKAGFLKRRKKILNSFKAAGYFSELDLLEIFEKSGIDPGERAEAVSLERFVKLTNTICCKT